MLVAGRLFSRGIRLRYWVGHPNFGDLLNLPIFQSYGFQPHYALAIHAEVFAAGSILQQVPDCSDAIIIGSGFLAEDCPTPDLRNANILALRGHLSKKKCGINGCLITGDPGLMAKRIFGSIPVSSHIGFVPHYSEVDHPLVRKFIENSNVKLIDPRDDVIVVARAIAESSLVLSSSLHGLVVADSYGIPAAHLIISNRLYGGLFKFDDYHSALNIRRDPVLLDYSSTVESLKKNARKVDPLLVEHICDQYDDLFRRLMKDLLRQRARRLWIRIGLILKSSPASRFFFG